MMVVVVGGRWPTREKVVWCLVGDERERRQWGREKDEKKEKKKKNNIVFLYSVYFAFRILYSVMKFFKLLDVFNSPSLM